MLNETAVAFKGDSRVRAIELADGRTLTADAVIIGIGSTIFHEFVIDFGGTPPTLEQVGSIALAALTLLGLAIFGPGIASGLISGGLALAAGRYPAPAFPARLADTVDAPGT